MWGLFSSSEQSETFEEEVEPKTNWEAEYPLHAAVLKKDLDKLRLGISEAQRSSKISKSLLTTDDVQISLDTKTEESQSEPPPDETGHVIELPINRKDSRGYSPLNLSIVTGFTDGANLLLEQGALTKVRHPQLHFHARHCCVLTHNRELLKAVLHADLNLASERLKTAGPKLRKRLKESRDFYMELDWNFTSWIPFTGKYCPSDSWKIWKMDDRARLDFTLVDFDQSAMRWIRGEMSVIVLPDKETGVVELHIIDHEKKEVSVTDQKQELEDKDLEIELQAEMLLQTEVILPKFDIMSVDFAPVLGYLGGEYRGEFAGCETQDYKLSNIQTQIGYCDGHIPAKMKEKEHKEERQVLLQQQMKAIDEISDNVQKKATMRKLINAIKEDFPIPELASPSLEEYFEDEIEVLPHKPSSYAKSLSLNVTVADGYPLNLKGDVLPILECFARAENPMLDKLRQFLDVDFPKGGFPVKIELPLYKVFRATVKFEVTILKSDLIPWSLAKTCSNLPLMV